MIETGAIDDAFLQELKNVCGADHVAADQLSRDLNSLTTDPQIRACGAIVYPASSAEVQAILKLCARHGVAVWPYSRGNNWGYGTKSALKPGALIMMLERMNRIIEVHPELAYAVIEPGVTQQQLFDHLGEQHPHLMADCTDSTPLGSVLGNAIERGYGYTPYGDHYGQLCGLEVVLPTGEILSTGGTDSSCPTWNTHKWGSGPSIDGLFSQGNLGVVVKGGIWLHPKPAHQVLFTVDISADQVSAAVDALRELALRGTLRCHVHMANAFQTLTLLQKMPAEWQARGVSIPPHELQRRTGKFGISDWTAVGDSTEQRRKSMLRNAIFAEHFAAWAR